jgi:uncharacterized lipoprotein NlpE involved in copper resistance
MQPSLRLFSALILSTLLFVFIGCNDNDDHDDDTTLITVDNIQGTYDLNIDDSTIVAFDSVGIQVISGTLVINDATFITTLAVTATDSGAFTLTGSTITITSADGSVSTDEVVFSDNGNTLTLVDETGGQEVWARIDGSGASDDLTLENLQGVYAFDKDRSTQTDFGLDSSSIISAELMINDMTFEATATAQVESSETFVIDGNIIELSDDDGEITRFTATLTETTLTLVDEFGDRFVFDRR